MEVTDVKIKLALDQDGPLQAYCSITLDGQFVVRDIKVIARQDGLFVAMPSRRVTVKCPGCANRIDVGARYCQSCGSRHLNSNSSRLEQTRCFADVAHPITAACRSKVEAAVLSAVKRETIRARQPGFTCVADLDDVA